MNFNPEDLYAEALRDFRENKPADAQAKLEQVLSLNPALEDAYEALAVIFYNQKKYDASIEVIGRWIGVNPNSAMAQTNLSRCYVAKGMILEAEKAQAEARRLGWKADLKAKKEAAPKINHAERISLFKQVIELDPADVLGYFSLGQAYFDAGQKREAVETFQKAIEVDPNHSSSYLGLGMALESLGDIKKAKEIYEKGIKVAAGRGDMMVQRKLEGLLRKIAN